MTSASALPGPTYSWPSWGKSAVLAQLHRLVGEPLPLTWAEPGWEAEKSWLPCQGQWVTACALRVRGLLSGSSLKRLSEELGRICNSFLWGLGARNG